MASNLLRSKEAYSGQEGLPTEDTGLRELVTSFVRHDSTPSSEIHDVVFRDLAVRGAGVGVSSSS